MYFIHFKKIIVIRSLLDLAELQRVCGTQKRLRTCAGSEGSQYRVIEKKKKTAKCT